VSDQPCTSSCECAGCWCCSLPEQQFHSHCLHEMLALRSFFVMRVIVSGRCSPALSQALERALLSEMQRRGASNGSTQRRGCISIGPNGSRMVSSCERMLLGGTSSCPAAGHMSHCCFQQPVRQRAASKTHAPANQQQPMKRSLNINTIDAGLGAEQMQHTLQCLHYASLCHTGPAK
jgi:hypothetical protein